MGFGQKFGTGLFFVLVAIWEISHLAINWFHNITNAISTWWASTWLVMAWQWMFG